MLPEKAKPVLLLLALACIVNSYLKSDAFKGNETGFIYRGFYEDLVCENRKEEQDECSVALAKALIPAQLSCLPLFRDLTVCRHPSQGRASKNACQEEMHQLSECFQTQVGPYGFSDDDVSRLLFGQGWQKKKNPKKANPQLDVSKNGEGSEEIAAQEAEKSKSEKGGNKTGNEAKVEEEAPWAGDKPTVEVDRGQGSESGKHYRGREVMG
eukprot:g16702.t1